MDKNGKIKGKVSIIDILVILLIVVVIVGIAARYGSSVTTAVQSDKQFEYVLRVENVRKYTVNALQKMGNVTDKKSEMNLGEIIDVRVENATQQSTTAMGEIKKPEMPGRYTCYVTIRATGKESEDNYILEDSTELSVGRNIDLYSKYVKTSGNITSVKVVD
ncbi:MAG: DUF4330 domain-containing protein [Hominilimicola sp.]